MKMPFSRRCNSVRYSISPGIIDFAETGRRRRGLDELGELGHLLLEIFQGAELGYVEHGQEAAVVVASLGVDAEAEAGEQGRRTFPP